MPISKTISKARPDHPSLDFEGLRTEGIRHLEHLATEVWTDYNAHDPGITLLELLCYAITDLGYRTRMLPVADLMADPQRDYKPWFTAAEVLPNAPVTGLDYRKLLIDVKGVKNAWVMGGDAEVAVYAQGYSLVKFIDSSTGQLDRNQLIGFLTTDVDFGLNAFPGDNDESKKAFIKELVNYVSSYLQGFLFYKKIENTLAFQLQQYGDFNKYAIHKIIKKIGSQGNGLNVIRPTIAEDAGYVWGNALFFDFPDLRAVLTPTSEAEYLERKLGEIYEKITQLWEEDNLRRPPVTFEQFKVYWLGVNIEPEVVVDEQVISNIKRFIKIPGSPLATNLAPGSPASKCAILFYGYEGFSSSEQKKFLSFVETIRTKQLELNGLIEEINSGIYPTQDFPGNKMRWKYSADLLQESGYPSPILPEVINALYQFNLIGKNDETFSKYAKWLKPLFCKFGLYPLVTDNTGLAQPDPLPLSGLYTILIDLDEDIDTGIPNCVNEVIDRVRNLLQAHRALCEDYVSIQVVEQRPIALCLSLDLAPDTDELEIVAEAVRLMQAYLSPVPRFRTFAQRVAELKEGGKNYSAEEIYNGPLLLNGFLVDEELGGSMPRNQYWHSDLLREIMSVQGILGAPNLKVNPTPEQASSSFDEITEYKVRGGDYDTPGEHYKPVIDLKRSYFQVTKGARTFQLDVDQIAERLELLRLINSPDPMEPVGGPVWEEGRYRPDLSSYRSLQYDLPVTYLVGDNRPPLDAKLQRKAQAKQLQAYLAFYDQIFASYLAQLGRVRQLLSIDQSADEPTRVLPLLYDMPGIRDLIGYDAPITAEAADWTSILLGIRDDLHSVVVLEGKNRKNDRQLVGQLLTELRSRTRFRGLFDLRDGLKKAFAAHPKLYELYGGPIEDHFWAKYTADDKNRYASLVKEMAESPADQRRRKNQLLDHLIARFGEAFGSYAATLLRPQSEPEDNPLQQTFEEYLEAKATFLRDIASLAAERNQAYNYKLFNNLENVADVWNTLNVSGLQKRISRKLGIKGWQTRSLIAEPPYRIDMQRGANNRGVANFKAVLRRRLEVHSSELNPLEAVPLLSSPPYASQRAAQNKINELYKSVWQAAYYPPSSAVPDAVDYWFTLLDETEGRKSAVMVKRYDPAAPKDSKTKIKTHLIKQAGVDVQVEIMLQSDPLSADEASNLIRDKVLPLVKPVANTREQEGFHIVEHILLRPMQADNNLLQLHLGCVPEEIPRDPYSFWITVVAPAETARFADADFRAYFEHEFRTETPAHIAVRFCYLGLEDMYKFEEVFAVWMFEKAKCSPNYCRAEEATNRLVQLLNDLHCSCGCPKAPELDPCQKQTS